MKIKEKTKILNYYMVAYIRDDKRYYIYLNRTFMWLSIDAENLQRVDIDISLKNIKKLDSAEVKNETYRRKKKN